MNDRRKQRGADESMYVHGEQRRSLQSRPFLTLLPPRPRSYRQPRLLSRSSEPLGLQVQGFCCPLQERPGSGRVTHRVTPQTRGGDDRRPTPLTSLESREGAESEMNPEAGGPAVCSHKDPAHGTRETSTAPCDNERQPGGPKVSELHLYLPSSLCEAEEQDAEADEARFSAVNTRSQESDGKPDNPVSPVSPNQ